MSRDEAGHQGYDDGYHRREYDPPTDHQDDGAAVMYQVGYREGRSDREECERLGITDD
jgi:hypothetical protein